MEGCPICGDLSMTAPVMLSCGHCFCWPCYKDYKDKSGESGSLCPTCRQAYGNLRPTYNIPGSTAMNDEELAVYGPRPNGVLLFEPVVTVSPPPSPPAPSPRRSTRTRTQPNERRRFFGYVLEDVNRRVRGHQSVSPVRRGPSSPAQASLPSPTQPILSSTISLPTQASFTSPTRASLSSPTQVGFPASSQSRSPSSTALPLQTNNSMGNQALDEESGLRDYFELEEGGGDTDIDWDDDLDDQSATSEHIRDPVRFQTKSFVPGTDQSHIEITLSCAIHELRSRKAKINKMGYSQIARTVRRKFPRSFDRKSIKDISKLCRNIVTKAVKEFKAGKRILPLSTESTEAKQARLSNIVSEIIVIDREAPVTARNYSNRNPPVPRSLSGRPRLSGPSVGVIAPDNDAIPFGQGEDVRVFDASQGSASVDSGGYNQQILTQEEREQARTDLNLNRPYLLSRRRNGVAGESAREESLEEMASRRLRGEGSAQDFNSFVSQNVVQNITRPRESAVSEILDRREERIAREQEEREERRRIEKEEKEYRRRIEKEERDESRRREEFDRMERIERLNQEKDDRQRKEREDKEDRLKNNAFMLAFLPKSTIEVGEGLKEITITQNKDQDSPDFPAVLAISTIPTLIDDIKTFLELDSWKPIAGIVTCSNDTFKIVTHPKHLPPEATVSVISKKGKDYFKLI